jgi:undecaprenyl-diphosphatase
MRAWVLELDHDLQRWVVTHRVDPLDHVFVFLSLIGSFGAVWVAIAVVLALRSRRVLVVPVTVATVILTDALTLLLKEATSRDRPPVTYPDPTTLVGTPIGMSFPSGHAATSAAGAIVLSWFAPRLTPLLLALAALIAASRVYVGVHYPLDVLAGLLFGAAVAGALRGMSLAAGARWSFRGKDAGSVDSDDYRRD